MRALGWAGTGTFGRSRSVLCMMQCVFHARPTHKKNASQILLRKEFGLANASESSTLELDTLRLKRATLNAIKSGGTPLWAMSHEWRPCSMPQLKFERYRASNAASRGGCLMFAKSLHGPSLPRSRCLTAQQPCFPPVRWGLHYCAVGRRSCNTHVSTAHDAGAEWLPVKT